MNQIQLEIIALSPLAIGRQKPGGSVSEAENYIPGSVVRGAIASEIIQQSGQQSTDLSTNGGDFQSLFLSQSPAIFQNAYPAEDAVNAEILVMPATAVSSKTTPGFKPKGNGVFDTLIDRFCAAGYGYPYDPNCPEDGGRVEPYSGFYSQVNGEHHTHSVTKRLLTRTGINRRRATVEEQVLYSIEVLNEVEPKTQKAMTYRGAIMVEDDNLAFSLAQFINARIFRLGGATSRGVGKVEIKANVIAAQPAVISRIEQFNQQLRQRWDTWKVFGDPPQELDSDRTYFTLDLQSDAILTEQWRRTTVISPAMLRRFAGVDDSSLELHVSYSSYDYRSGWNAAWGLMKDVELITNKGGLYLFSTSQPESWIPALEEMEMRGVGSRTSEGFGQIQVGNEFHLVFREAAV